MWQHQNSDLLELIPTKRADEFRVRLTTPFKPLIIGAIRTESGMISIPENLIPYLVLTVVVLLFYMVRNFDEVEFGYKQFKLKMRRRRRSAKRD